MKSGDIVRLKGGTELGDYADLFTNDDEEMSTAGARTFANDDEAFTIVGFLRKNDITNAGFSAMLYQNGNKIIVLLRGTASVNWVYKCEVKKVLVR